MPILIGVLGYGVINIINSKRRKMKMRWEENNKAMDKMCVKEWLHPNAKRYIKVEALHLLNRKGVELRKIVVSGVDTELIDSMFKSSGFEDKESLSYDDFKTMMKEFKGDFLAISLDCKGARQNFLDTTTNVARMQSFAVDAIEERHRHWVFKKWDTLTR